MRSRKLFPIILCLVVILSVPSSFAATHASTCLSSYAVGLYAEGNGEMDVEFEILGTNIMDKVGVYSLLIEEEVLPDVWVFHSIVYGEDNESTFSPRIQLSTKIHTHLKEHRDYAIGSH